MSYSDMFEYEEHEGKKYLIYEKRETDILDTFTVQMLSNNKIEGAALFSCIRMDRSVHMKYNISGFKTLREVFSDMINRQKFLGILESLADALIRAEDYMLDLAVYVLDESFIYVAPDEMKVFLIVLPIKREGEKAETFLKQLMFDARYDQTEDCSYVASLMNFLGNEREFSLRSFKQQVLQFKKKNLNLQGDGSRILSDALQAEVKKAGNESHSAKHEVSPVKTHTADTREKQENLQILFSDHVDEEPGKKKKGFFSKKGKSENQEKEKKSFFRKREEKKDTGSFSGSSVKSPLSGVAIPGMDILGKFQADHGSDEGEDDKKDIRGQEIHIPVQQIQMSRQEVAWQDFGETVYADEEAEAPTIFEEEKQGLRQRFTLYRCSTQETFEIKGDVVRIGRSPSISEICIAGNRGVGRVHAVLYVQGGQVYIADNNSKNKTYVDGVQLKPGESPTMLLSGSKIKLGTEELEFRISR